MFRCLTIATAKKRVVFSSNAFPGAVYFSFSESLTGLQSLYERDKRRCMARTRVRSTKRVFITMLLQLLLTDILCVAVTASPVTAGVLVEPSSDLGYRISRTDNNLYEHEKMSVLISALTERVSIYPLVVHAVSAWPSSQGFVATGIRRIRVVVSLHAWSNRNQSTRYNIFPIIQLHCCVALRCEVFFFFAILRVLLRPHMHYVSLLSFPCFPQRTLMAKP